MTDTASDVTAVCRDGELTSTVVSAVAEAKGVDPLELEPLYSYVDPDALNRLFRPSDRSTSIEFRFQFADCVVEIGGDREVTVTPPAAADESRSAVVSHAE